ncbi:hypothetical protein ALQ53_103849 [Pseudomonas cannabina]|uniref:Uncharacterized protein n=1 Tax=Pseudomonas cannabina TaxID=86840 RepID=A0AB37QDY5_PSECA|nr:Unknown protein sequence [Pseudomonas syringae pv. maculicola]RMN84296.1 hypothetical protein ALQ53_103849 [Pseudomonas cannabina]
MNSKPIEARTSSDEQPAKQWINARPSSVLDTLKEGDLSKCAGHFAMWRFLPDGLTPSSL